jgi:hypothetical protein
MQPPSLYVPKLVGGWCVLASLAEVERSTVVEKRCGERESDKEESVAPTPAL